MTAVGLLTLLRRPRRDEEVPADVALDPQRVVEVEDVAPALADGRQRHLGAAPLEVAGRELEVEAPARGVVRARRDGRADEELRVVVLELPKGSQEALRKLEGFEDSDTEYEVLECFIAGTGTKDAPRDFALKLKMFTQEALGFQP